MGNGQKMVKQVKNMAKMVLLLAQDPIYRIFCYYQESLLSFLFICTNEKILVDAEQAVKKDNFELATEKLLTLPKPVRVQMMDWLELAEDRLDAYRLLTELKQLVFVELSQKK